MGQSSMLIDFHVSVSLISAANWFTEGRLYFSSIDFVLILSDTLELLSSLSKRFCDNWSDFMRAGILSSGFCWTFVHSCNPYLSLLTHKLWTTFISLHFGMWWDTHRMVKSLWLRLDVKLRRWTFHSWDSSICIPRSFVCWVL